MLVPADDKLIKRAESNTHLHISSSLFFSLVCIHYHLLHSNTQLSRLQAGTS